MFLCLEMVDRALRAHHHRSLGSRWIILFREASASVAVSIPLSGFGDAIIGHGELGVDEGSAEVLPVGDEASRTGTYLSRGTPIRSMRHLHHFLLINDSLCLRCSSENTAESYLRNEAASIRNPGSLHARVLLPFQ